MVRRVVSRARGIVPGETDDDAPRYKPLVPYSAFEGALASGLTTTAELGIGLRAGPALDTNPI